MAEDIDLERLREVVGAYGADPGRWPHGERAALEPLARTHEAAPWMVDARGLDMMLDAVPSARMSAGLAAGIVAAARSVPRADPQTVVPMPMPAGPEKPRRLSTRLLAGSGPATILAASLAAGLWLGATNEIDTLVNGEPLGLAELAPGVNEEATLSVLLLETLGDDVSLP